MSEKLESLLQTNAENLFITSPDTVRESVMNFSAIKLGSLNATQSPFTGKNSIDYIRKIIKEAYKLDSSKIHDMTIGEYMTLLRYAIISNHPYFYTDSKDDAFCSYISEGQTLNNAIFPAYIAMHLFTSVLQASKSYELKQFFNIALFSFADIGSKCSPNPKLSDQLNNTAFEILINSRSYYRLHGNEDVLKEITVGDALSLIREESIRPFSPGVESAHEYIDHSLSIYLSTLDFFMRNVYCISKLNVSAVNQILKKYK